MWEFLRERGPSRKLKGSAVGVRGPASGAHLYRPPPACSSTALTDGPARPTPLPRRNAADSPGASCGQTTVLPASLGPRKRPDLLGKCSLGRACCTLYLLAVAPLASLATFQVKIAHAPCGRDPEESPGPGV